MVRRVAAPILSLILVAVVSAQQAAPERIDASANARIRAEGMERSQVMRIVHVLTDVYGGRLTGSPNYQNAAEWAVKEMASWGMTNAHLEPFDWGREGWWNDKASGHIVSPVKDNLVFEVVAWTKSTSGTVTAPAVNLVPPQGPIVSGGRGGQQQLGPTEEELTTYLNGMAPKVRGAIVLVGAPVVPAFVENETPKRRDDEQVRRQYNPAPVADGQGGGRGGGRGGGAPAAGRGQQQEAQPARLSAQTVNNRIRDFLRTNGAAVRVNDAGRRHGQIIVQAGYGYVAAETIPTVILRNEDYGRIARMLGDGIPVTLEFTIQNSTYPDARTQHNVIAEIRGTDKADEVVMLGGHFDSWHGATGATDNAVGCAIMMEAARILKTIGVQPRRTIRVALWGAEEQGLIGSQAYVRDHFGSAESPKPEFSKFSAYWNIDTGTGLLRGASVFGPPEGARILAQLLKPWEEFKVYGATTSNSRSIGGTDHTSFANAGLPGIGTSLDPIEYNTHTHHFNLDTYERVLPDDVKKNAVVTASVIYHLAMRDDLMPRFPAGQMPQRPGPQR
jgi:hypothetical protein